MVKIGTVVNELGVPASTIRYYERIGLIKPLARAGNSRYLDQNDIDILKFVRMSQVVGFSISEIKELLTAFAKDSVDNEKCDQLVREKISELDTKMQDLARMRFSLSQAVDCHCASLQSCVEDIENFGCE